MPDPVTSEGPGDATGVDIVDPPRRDLDIDPGTGLLAAGGTTATFAPDDPDALLESYLRLVRRLRDQQRADEVSLRRDEVERLAAHLGTSGETVLERLGTLMGATKAQRRMMAGLFLAGAMVITVAVPSVAALSGGSGDGAASPATSIAAGAVTASGAAGAAVEPRPAATDDGNADGDAEDATRSATIDVRSGPDGPGAISVDLLTRAEPTAEPPTADEPVEPVAETPTDVVSDPAPPPPEPAAPVQPDPPAEPVEVAVGPPPEPDPPSVIVEPAPAPTPAPPPAPPPAPVDGATDADEMVAVGPPPIPPPDAPIVDPPGH